MDPIENDPDIAFGAILAGACLIAAVLVTIVHVVATYVAPYLS